MRYVTALYFKLYLMKFLHIKSTHTLLSLPFTAVLFVVHLLVAVAQPPAKQPPINVDSLVAAHAALEAAIRTHQLSGSTPSDIRLPLNPAIRTGELSNGLQYYILQNDTPKEFVELRLIVGAGSVLEDDDQLGMAHFVEHMAFNGTTNFKKNAIVEFLEELGLEFGADLNAFTSFNETVYILPIPTERPENVDRALFVLGEWASQIQFEDEEVEKERGVIVEEWRLRQGAMNRYIQEYFPILLKGSRYANRLPIGNKESIEQTSAAAIRRFYTDWYRPDLMAIVVVGDIDVEEIERKVQDQFNRIPIRTTSRERRRYTTPLRDKPDVFIFSDPEQTSTTISIRDALDYKPFDTWEDYKKRLAYQLIGNMFSFRTSALTRRSDPPFNFARLSFNPNVFGSSLDFLDTEGNLLEGKIEAGISTVFTELRRAVLHGFTQGELDRERKRLLASFRNDFKGRNTRDSEEYASEIIQHHLGTGVALSAQDKFQQGTQLTKGITLEYINELLRSSIRPNARVVSLSVPQKEGVEVPTQTQILRYLQAAERSNPSPYVYAATTDPLLPKNPQPGSVQSEEEAEYGSTKWVLSNGATVYVKPTDFEEDEVLFQSFSYGGRTQVPADRMLEAAQIGAIIEESGIGAHDKQSLEGLLAGNNISLEVSIGDIATQLNGRSTPEDLEAFLQLLHLYYTAPRVDTAAFNGLRSSMIEFSNSLARNPMSYFSLEVFNIIEKDNPLFAPQVPDEEAINALDLDQAFEIYRQAVANAGGFNFYFVGNFDSVALKPLVEKYIGSLPSTQQPSRYDEEKIYKEPITADYKEFYRGIEPLSVVLQINTVQLERTPQTALSLEALSNYLNIALIRSLREASSQVYSASVNVVALEESQRALGLIFFPCKPSNVKGLLKKIDKQLRKVQKGKIDKKTLQSVKEQLRQDFNKASQENGFWIRNLRNQHLYNRASELDDYLARLDKLSAKDLQTTAQQLFDKNHQARFVLFPKEDLNKK